MKKRQNYTIDEAAKLTGLSPNALRKRMDRGRLGCVMSIMGGQRRRLIPHEELMAAGLIGNPTPTRYEKGAQRLVKYLSRRKDAPVTTSKLEQESGLPRQQIEAVMAALLALGHVRKSHEPPRIGTGRPRVVWRWLG
jgi:excisionase family DNA binding protein